MHLEATRFINFVKQHFPEYFYEKKVLDVGGGDINGNNRYLFEKCEIVVNDVAEADNVTLVSKTKDLPFPPETFDTIISTECFEHDPEYPQSFQKIYELLKPGGLLFFTCASTGRPEHGTRRTNPNHSIGSKADLEDMRDYYRNLTIEDIDPHLFLENNFSFFDAYYNEFAKDLYFVGIKKGNGEIEPISFYYSPGIHLTKSSRQPSLLDKIFEDSNSEKKPSFHHYTRQYSKLLEPFQHKKIRILEIGVKEGQSLLSWKKFFKNADYIVGVDNNPRCKANENRVQNIFVEIMDSTEISLVSLLKEKYRYFDIIIDDGSHLYSEITQNFMNLFPLLKEDGIYICESTCHYKSQTPSFMENHINFFAQCVPFLNQWRYDSVVGIRDHCADPFKIQKITTNAMEYSIDKIEFGCSYVAITKKTRFHWIPNLF